MKCANVFRATRFASCVLIAACCLLFMGNSTAHSQSINGVPNQSMSGFSPVVGGAPIIASNNNYLGETGPITNQIECSTTVCGAGEYLIVVSITPTTSPVLGTISLTLNFIDNGGAQSVTAISALLLTQKTSASAVYCFYSTGTANITWSTTVAGISGSYVYEVHPRILKLS